MRIFHGESMLFFHGYHMEYVTDGNFGNLSWGTGRLLHSGKSHFFIGKSFIHGLCSIAMLNYRRVNIVFGTDAKSLSKAPRTFRRSSQKFTTDPPFFWGLTAPDRANLLDYLILVGREGGDTPVLIGLSLLTLLIPEVKTQLLSGMRHQAEYL